ncbi:translation elongation factor Ts [Batrachochytrium salamandrivorans]|nr:translation elongation factor Ts [Batrachochytrium salamandrivorans]
MFTRRLFSTQGIKALREATGAPLVDCKRALTEHNGDTELAKKWLFERSKQAKEKLSQRQTKQGLVGLGLDSTVGVISEVQCETDFVASNPEFQTLVQQQTAEVLAGRQVSQDVLTAAVGKIRENILLGQTRTLKKTAEEQFGSYIHNSTKGLPVGTSAAIVAVLGASQDLAKQLAVHVVGAKPIYLTKESVPKEEVEAEQKRIVESSQDLFQGKPEKAREMIVKSKLGNFFSEKCLLEQTFAFGEWEGKVVKDVLKPTQAKISGFVRLSVGE